MTRLNISEADILALHVMVGLAQAAARDIREHPGGTLARAWRDAEILDGGEIVAPELPLVLAAARQAVHAITNACGVQVPS